MTGDKLLIKLQCGLGNNLFQILGGAALAQRIAARRGEPLDWHVIVPDPPDLTQPFSVFETLGGHLRGDLHFGRRHRDFGLPEPHDLPAIFPRLRWLDLAKVAAPSAGTVDMSAAFERAYFQTSRFETTMDDESFLRDDENSLHGQVVHCHFLRTTYPFPMTFWYPELDTLARFFEPSAATARYLEQVHGVTNDSELVGIHIRNDRRAGDVEPTRPVSLAWYLDGLAEALPRYAKPRIVLVANRVAGNEASFSDELAAAIAERWPTVELVQSSYEPYYVDFFLLRACRSLLISISTFGFTAGLVAPRRDALYVPNGYSERHFMDDVYPPFCRLLPDR